jgi:hypothetical protein
LSQSLQKRDQDIVNAMTLVGVAKRRFQQLRSDGWEDFLEKVKSFCIKYSIDIPAMDSKYEPHGRSHRFYPVQTIDDHYRREVFIGIIDRIHQELENRFDEVSRELLICMSALSPSNSFASFDAQKILKLATFYPKDISSSELRTLEIQLGTYIEDVKMDVRFEGLNTLGELSNKLVDTKKHEYYGLVYLVLKLALILPVATASVERVFSALCLVKNKVRNSMSDRLLNDCLVTFIERDIFSTVSEDDIVHAFMAMRKRKVGALN